MTGTNKFGSANFCSKVAHSVQLRIISLLRVNAIVLLRYCLHSAWVTGPQGTFLYMNPDRTTLRGGRPRPRNPVERRPLRRWTANVTCTRDAVHLSTSPYCGCERYFLGGNSARLHRPLPPRRVRREGEYGSWHGFPSCPPPPASPQAFLNDFVRCSPPTPQGGGILNNFVPCPPASQRLRSDPSPPRLCDFALPIPPPTSAT